MSKLFVPKVVIFTIFILLFSTVGETFLAFANTTDSLEDFREKFENESLLEDLTYNELDKLSDTEIEDLGVNTDNGAEEFNHEILDENFDFEASVDNLDISKMNEVEKKEFIKTIEEAAAISGTEEVELLEEALIGIFDGNSETFNDLKAAQEQLEENYVEKLEYEELALFSKAKNLLFGSEKVYASNKQKGKVRVGVYFAGSVFNVAIGGVVGGGVSAVKSYIKKKGKKAATEGISRVATAQAKKLGIQTVRGVAIATVIGGAVSFALDYADVGVAIAKFLDSKDWYKNNGWIDITK
ncbi:hypothetical protein [Peribacillus phoenicis]|uniref:hypothetical protein n=1 Tax=unclassified Peribacillus TaxID=2675266 RepID=UPI0039A30D3C